MGGISATAGPSGVGVAFTINFSNLPTSGGPFRKYCPPECKNFADQCSLPHPCYAHQLYRQLRQRFRPS
jgi:hypothetical protein